MPQDDSARVEFAATLAAVSAEEHRAAHDALRDPLAPLVADVERAVRDFGPTPFRRRDAAAYRTSSELAGRTRLSAEAQLDLKY
jgi:hypothetical protein